MNLFDLSAKITLDTGEFERGIKNVIGKGKSLASTLGGGIATAAKVGATAVAAGAAAVTAIGAALVKTGMQFDSSMSQVAATMGYSVEELNTAGSEAQKTYETLRNFAQEMGATTAFSASQSADALNYMALAGYDAETSMQMLPNVLNLAAAGGMELATASDMVTDAQSALGLSIDDTTKMVDQMAKASSKSNTSVSQLGEAMLTIGATAQSVKGGTTELSTMLGVLADNGIKGAEGGTKLRNIIMSLQSPTSEGAKALQQLGVNVYDADGNMRGLTDIVGDLQNGLGDMDQASRDALINGIFNKADVAAVNALLNTSKNRFDELTSAIKNSEGAASDMAAVQLDNLQGDVTLFKSALEGAQIAISDKLTPELRNFVQFGTDGLGRLSNAFSNGGLKGAMGELGTLLGEGIAMITSYVPDIVDAGVQLISGLVQALVDNAPQIIDAFIEMGPTILEGAGTIVGTLGQGLIDNLPMLVDAASDMVIGLADYLADNADAIVDWAVDLIITLGESLVANAPKLANAAIRVVQAFVSALIRNAPRLFTAVKTAIHDLLVDVFNVDEDTANAFVDTIDAVFETIGGIIDSIKTAIGSITEPLDNVSIDWASVWNGMSEIISTVGEYIGTAIELIGEAIGGIVDWLVSLGEEAQTEGTIMNDIWTGIQDLFTAVWDAIGAIIDQAIEQFQSVMDAFSWLRTQMETDGTAINTVWENIQLGISTCIDIITGVINVFTALLTGDFSGAWDAIQTTIDSVVSNISDAVSNTFGYIADTLSNIGTNIKNDITNKWDSIKSNVSSKVDTIKSNISSKWDTIKSNLQSKMDTIKTNIANKWDTIKTNVGDKVESIKTNITDKFDTIKNNVRDKFDAIKNAISDKLTAARDKVHDLIESIKSKFNFTWSLPHLKLPHPYISGSFSLNPPSVPSFGISWYRKAMSNPYTFDHATLFGAGEAGDEILYGKHNLMQDIRDAVQSAQTVQPQAATTVNATINVYAAKGQSEREIGIEVQRALTNLMTRQRVGAFA